MKKTNLIGICVILGVLFAACAKGPGNKVVARIGWEKITVGDLNQRIKNVPLNYREYIMSDTGKKQFIDVLVRQKIMIAMAKKKGIAGKKEILQAVDDFKKDYAAKIKQYEDELLVEAYLKELEDKDLKVTDAEAAKYYNEHKKDFARPTEVRLSHILVATEPEAETLIKKIGAGVSFEEVARKSSLDPMSAEKDGDLGKFKRTEILPEFIDTVNALSVGEYSKKPIKTSFGYHVLKKTGEKVLPAIKKEEAEQEIRKLLLKEKFDKWIDEQKKRLGVKVDYSAFK